jgi:PKD repeat protein
MRKIVLGIFVILLCINLVLGAYEIQNSSIDIFYSRGEPLRGWINISFEEENSDSLLTAFSSNITLLNFLENAGVDFWCSPRSCFDFYTANSGGTSKNFSLNIGEDKLIGLRLQGQLQEDPITDILFRVDTDVENSCFKPLELDILNDGEVNWWSTTPASSFIECSYSTGCFNDSEETVNYRMGSTPYCQRIRVPALPVFKVGATIIKGSSSHGLEVRVYDSEMQETDNCDIDSVGSSGEYLCNVELNLRQEQDIFVCVNSMGGDHQIKGESVNPCGFFGIEDYEDFRTDYSIVAKGGKYGPIGSFSISEAVFEDYNDNSLKEYLNNYLDEVYDNNCSDSCVIPIRFTAGESQNISLSNLVLEYNTISGTVPESRFYEISKKPAKISSGFSLINLEHANLLVPFTSGGRRAVVMLDGEQIARQDIEVSESDTKILDIVPREAAALVLFNFVAIVDSLRTNLTYEWNFGDGNKETTKNSAVTHTYSSIGTYNLTLVVKDSSRQNSKTVSIKVLSPKEHINKTIAEYRDNLNQLERDLEGLEPWIKEYVEERIDIGSLKASLDSEEERYNEGFINEETAIDIMTNLIEIEIPEYLRETKKITKSQFFPSQDNLDLETLEDVGAGLSDGSREQYVNAIVNWMNSNMDVFLTSRTYTLSYKNREDLDLFSYIKISFEPKNEISEFFVITEGDNSLIKFKDDVDIQNIGENAVGTRLVDLAETSSLELLYPSTISVVNAPIYFSPLFSDLELGVDPDIGICNNNGKCEEERGETSENCKADCGNSLLITLLLLAILLFVFLVVYIILQEWYKRSYESRLFKNRNQLFNLINFIYNAENQGMSKSEIFDKLKEQGWKKEQLVFAWNRYKGKRNGMWEIPIFKGSENKRVREEIRKRQ